MEKAWRPFVGRLLLIRLNLAGVPRKSGGAKVDGEKSPRGGKFPAVVAIARYGLAAKITGSVFSRDGEGVTVELDRRCEVVVTAIAG